MSTSDQNGEAKLTRKQLRELRLTGSTPVITEEEAAAQAAPPSPLPRAAEPAHVAPPPSAEAEVDPEHEPLTRREAREQERVRTGAMPVQELHTEQVPERQVVTAAAVAGQASQAPIVASVPTFAPHRVTAPVEAEPERAPEPQREPETVVEVQQLEVETVEVVTEVGTAAPQAPRQSAPAPTTAPQIAADEAEDGRATVNSAFGRAVGQTAPAASIPQLFDDIIDGDSGGSQHTAPNAIIFNPAPGSGSLSGPVASTGELLVTGSYELPQGLGSQGHAHGTTDGKDVDAVLIDGELPPTSSPTPIAASSAVSTSKPAGEVIRPPAPEKGNKLMLTLAIVAGGLALALAAVIVVAINTNVFG